MKEIRQVELGKCAKCGAPARLEEGQAWDQEKRRYLKCYRYACWKCSSAGPVREDPMQAAIAWNTVQAEVTPDDQLS